MDENHAKNTTHYYDIWHQAKSTVKKVLKASKEKDCEILAEWAKSIRNHLYWCATSSQAGFSSLIEAKWLSFMRHVNNEHVGHPNASYDKCHHGDITENKKWIKVSHTLMTLSLFSKIGMRLLKINFNVLFLNTLVFKGSKPYQKLKNILTKTTLVKDVKKRSPVVQTSSLEGFHSVLNHWHPKMICFSWLGTYCRSVVKATSV